MQSIVDLCPRPWSAGSGCAADDHRELKDELLSALCSWWDAAGEVSPAGVSAYAPKYQVVCKETVQKLLFAWLRADAARELYPWAASLSYQEFASKLGEPNLWSTWWAQKIEPSTGVSWSNGQWCRLYRLHNALPPFVQLRTLSAADVDGGSRPDGPWLAVQGDVLRCLEDWWDAVGMVLPAKCRADSSFTICDLDDLSFAQADDSMLEQSCNDVSMDYTVDLDTTVDYSLDGWNEQLLNHRDLVQGLYEWLHSSPALKRRYPMASAADKYSFRAHLNRVWGLWWARKVEIRSGVPWSRCGRFNRRLRLPSFIRLRERASGETELTRDSEASDAVNSITGPAESHRSLVRSALLEAFRDWWQEAGVVLRPEEMTEPMKRDLHSDHNVTKHKIQSLLYAWLRTPAAAAAHPMASSVKFRALSSMLGYLWGRWWDLCVASIAGVRWGGSGRFSNKGVLPPFVRLREAFAGSDGPRHAPSQVGPAAPLGLSQIDYESDGDELDDSRASCLLDSSFLADLPDSLDEALLPHGHPPLFARRSRPAPAPSGLGPRGSLAPTGASGCMLSAYSHHLQSGLLEVLSADDTDDAPSTLQTDFDIELESPFTPSALRRDSRASTPAISRASSMATPEVSPIKRSSSAWEAVDWSPTTVDGQSPSLFTSEHLHTIPVDGPAAGYHSWETPPATPTAAGAKPSHHQHQRLPHHHHKQQQQQTISVTVTTTEAAIRQQAQLLSDLIATRSALSPSQEELAQLNMAKHLLQGVAGGPAPHPHPPVAAPPQAPLGPMPPPPATRSTASLSDRLSALMLGSAAAPAPPVGQQRRRGLAARLMPSMYQNFQRSRGRATDSHQDRY